MTAAKLKLISFTLCPYVQRAMIVLNEKNVPFDIEYIDIDVDENKVGLDLVKQVNGGRRVVPTIIFPDNSILVEPSNGELAEKLGISLGEMV